MKILKRLELFLTFSAKLLEYIYMFYTHWKK